VTGERLTLARRVKRGPHTPTRQPSGYAASNHVSVTELCRSRAAPGPGNAEPTLAGALV